nr:hypothetical protein [Tanacetum cinerariifolium]
KSGDANSSSSEIAKLTHAVNQQTSAYQCLAADGNTFLELRDNIQGYVAVAAVNYNQGNSDYRPPGEDERVEETLTDQDPAEYTIKKILKALLSNKEKLLKLANTPLNENCSAIILKKLPGKLRDPRKFLIPCGFSELKCKALADLANQAICTPAGIIRDVFIPVGKFTFPADFFIVDYKSDPRVPLILGRPFLRTARTLIDVHREEMILRDGDERLTLNMIHDTSSYSNQPQKESINNINIYDDSSEDFLKELFTTNHQSGNLIFSSHPKLTSPEVKDDIFDPERGNVLIEKLLDLNSTKDPREKMLNINLFIAQIKSLNGSPTPDHVLKPPSLFPILIKDSDSFLDKSDTSLSYSDNSLPEYETFSNQTEETNSGSTTTHADYSLSKYDSFLFEIKPDLGELTSVVIFVEPRVHVPNVLTTHPTLMLDLNFIPSDNSLPESEIFYFDIKEKNSGSTIIHDDISHSDLECFNFKPDLGELTSIVDLGIRENVPSSTNVNLPPEKDHSLLFAYRFCLPLAPPWTNEFGDWVKLSDPKQALRRRNSQILKTYAGFFPSVFNWESNIQI